MWLDSWLWRSVRICRSTSWGNYYMASCRDARRDVCVAACEWHRRSRSCDFLVLGSNPASAARRTCTMAIRSCSPCCCDRVGVSRCRSLRLDASRRGAATVAAITGVWTGFATNMRHEPLSDLRFAGHSSVSIGEFLILVAGTASAGWRSPLRCLWQASIRFSILAISGTFRGHRCTCPAHHISLCRDWVRRF